MRSVFVYLDQISARIVVVVVFVVVVVVFVLVLPSLLRTAIFFFFSIPVPSMVIFHGGIPQVLLVVFY